MTPIPEPAPGEPAGAEGSADPPLTDSSIVERRRADMLEQLIEMRRDEAAAEDAEDFGWAEELRAHPFRPARDNRQPPGSAAPA